nr:hypothetical protein [Tanacetum cinerariifolium]
WDLDKAIWGGRVGAIGTVPVCCRSTGELGKGSGFWRESRVEDDNEDPEKDPEEDPSEEHKPEDDDDDPEEDPNEEHESKGSEETEPFEEDEIAIIPPPPRHRGARISVRPQTPMAASTQAL